MLHVHRSERADGLVDALARLLAHPPVDPFAPEIVCVPTRGMERWLTQRLSACLGTSPGRQDGICANVDFPFPHRLVTEAVAAATGIDPDDDPWQPERAAWPLLEVVEQSLSEPWLASLGTHLLRAAGPDGEPRARRLSTVRHIADLFDRYALHRPEMIRAWAAGQDSFGDGRPLPRATAWQAELWRRLRDRIGIDGPAERLELARSRLAGDPGAVALPERLSLFGLTRLPAGHLGILRVLADARAVHLFLLHPSPGLWSRIAALAGSTGRVARRRDDLTASLARNRLLASWGRDAREMQLVLARCGTDVDEHHPPHCGVLEPRSLLERLQRDVHLARRPPGPPAPGSPDERPPLPRDDGSVQVHACHGRSRQVEVLRELILRLLSDDPTLEPRDVLVMCPDIETFAPLIQATFGSSGPAEAGEDGRAPDLRVRLADRALRQTNPVLGTVAMLLELAGSRMTASQVLDLADREPVRRRFGLDDDDIERLQGWIADSGIRWGLDPAHREPYSMQAFEAGTWRTGLDRVLVGVTMTEERRRLWSGVLPVDDVESGAIDLAGRFAELIERLTEAVDSFSRPMPLGGWAAAIARATDALTATADRDAWQRGELQRILEALSGEAVSGGLPNQTVVSLPEVRALLAERLQGRPTRANFRTGSLTVCTLVPMRSVPHRVVCLLGLDDDVFPRRAARDGDDLMLEDPHVGERDGRSEDRQLLLDALLAATERVIVTYTGNDERTNAPRPPAVPVGELLEAIDATVHPADVDPAVEAAAELPQRARAQVLVHHPLQPFDPRNFVPGGLCADAPFSFDRVMHQGARALTAPRLERPAFLAAPLPPAPAAVVELEDLVRFVQHPVRAFLRRRLGIGVSEWSDEVADGLPVELDGLERWGVGRRVLEARLEGVAQRPALLAEIARGELPPGVLGRPVLTEIGGIVEQIVAQTESLVSGRPAPASIDVRIALRDGRSVRGTVPQVSGSVLWAATYSRLAAKHRLSAWVRLLALVAARPEIDYTAAIVGRGTGGARGPAVSLACIGSLGVTSDERLAAALSELEVVVDLHDRGMREPLPLYCATSAAYAAAAAQGEDPVSAAQAAWKSGWKVPGEDADPEHALVLGGRAELEDVLASKPLSDEAGPGWALEHESRLGRLAVRLWSGLLAREQVSGC